MPVRFDGISRILTEKGLKKTPQRIAILGAIYALHTHPTAEQIIEAVRKEHPAIATGTVYKVLDVLTSKGIVAKVKTEGDVMRYDGVVEHHHHLYCTSCDRIRDYVDDELDEHLKNYFKKKNVPGFEPKEFVLQIKGTFDDC